jgi:hypothetical protein
MSSRISDEREQRRGLILGLTLAEVLLLLLFLLLLALARQMQVLREETEQAQRDLESLRPLQESLMSNGAGDITSVQGLAARFRRVQEMESEVADLKEKAATFSQQTELLKSVGLDDENRLRAVANTFRVASQFDPNDPPAFLKRAVEVLHQIGPNTQPEQLKLLSQINAGGSQTEKITLLEADRDKIRRERDNLMRSGNGLTYPSCWTTSTGQTEYIFDVTFTDVGLAVRNASPGRAGDKAWSLISTFDRDKIINENMFVSATKRLFEWSKEQNCRFYIIIRDQTGPTNKERYKRLQQMVQGNFYPLYLSRQRRTPEPVPSVRPGESGVGANDQSSGLQQGH